MPARHSGTGSSRHSISVTMPSVPSAPIDEIEHVARGEIGIEGIAGGVLPNAGKPAGDERSSRAEPRSDILAEAPQRSGAAARLIHASSERDFFGISRDQCEPLDPAPHAAEPHRSCARGVGRDHASECGPGAARGIRWEPQTMIRGGRVELGECDGGASRGSAGGRIDMQRVGESSEVHHHPVTDVSSSHGAAGTSRHEWYPVLTGPGGEELQIGCIARQRHCAGNDPVDPCALGIRCSGPGVSAEDAAKCRRRQHRPKLIMFTCYG